jgi:hypothetical protein
MLRMWECRLCAVLGTDAPDLSSLPQIGHEQNGRRRVGIEGIQPWRSTLVPLLEREKDCGVWLFGCLDVWMSGCLVMWKCDCVIMCMFDGVQTALHIFGWDELGTNRGGDESQAYAKRWMEMTMEKKMEMEMDKHLHATMRSARRGPAQGERMAAGWAYVSGGRYHVVLVFEPFDIRQQSGSN